MYRSKYSNSSDPSAERLSKIMDLTIQSSQGNDGLLREIQEATEYIKENDPSKFKTLIGGGITIFSDFLNTYDEMTTKLSNYKKDFNGYITEQKKDD